MKICIVGFSDSGKSTTAENISDILTIKPIYLDVYRFNVNWEARDAQSMEKDLLEQLKGNENWVIEGDYRKVYLDRFKQADYIIFLNFNRFRCLWGVIKRYIKFKNKDRVSRAKGCNENLSVSFLHWLLFGSRAKKQMQFYKDLNELYTDKFIELKSRRQLNIFLKNLNKEDNLYEKFIKKIKK